MTDVERAAQRYQAARNELRRANKRVEAARAALEEAEQIAKRAGYAWRYAEEALHLAAAGERGFEANELDSEPPRTLAEADAQIAKLIEANRGALDALANL